MRELTIDEIKKRQLNMLSWIDALCRKESIDYSIAYGTMIGAVRHGGYIPWDDDVDLFMTRENLNKFLRSFDELKSSDYHRLNWENNYFNFVKIIDSATTVEEDNDYNLRNYGVWLDIFPVDYLPDPKSDRAKKQYKKMSRLFKLSQIRGMHFRHFKRLHFPKNIVWAAVRLILGVFPLGYFGRRVDETYLEYNASPTEFMGYLPQCPIEKNTFPANYFDEYIDMNFDGIIVRCLKKYDDLLKGYYGDYMQPPPEGERKSGHNYRAFLKN